ncbi:hypothetical protein, partial [Helicobacter canis]|uniref:hypothetical protein n=1 Tax=Helicobacter canis TaxID=29419 RepID=UPI0026F1500A
SFILESTFSHNAPTPSLRAALAAWQSTKQNTQQNAQALESAFVCLFMWIIKEAMALDCRAASNDKRGFHTRF